MPRGNAARVRAFTLIELLVVIAIIALLIGILLPAIGSARQSARNLLCQTNIRQIAQATQVYAVDFKGKFPPVLAQQPFVIDPENGKQNMIWYDVNRIGRYLPQVDSSNLVWNHNENPTVGGSVMECPNHTDAGRSYTMNYWAASAAELVPNMQAGTIRTYRPGTLQTNANTYQNGTPFNDDTGRASALMLYAESWAPYRSQVPNTDGSISWFSSGSIGSSQLPGERFGGGDGLLPSRVSGNWHQNPTSPELGSNASQRPKSYVPYYRHPPNLANTMEIDGSANIAFVDGHVERYSPKDLFVTEDDITKSTYEVLWSEKDQSLERDLDGD